MVGFARVRRRLSLAALIPLGVLVSSCSGAATPTSPTLVLCTSTMTDRTGRIYGKAVPPDEEIADPVEMVRRAIEWLR